MTAMLATRLRQVRPGQLRAARQLGLNLGGHAALVTAAFTVATGLGLLAPRHLVVRRRVAALRRRHPVTRRPTRPSCCQPAVARGVGARGRHVVVLLDDVTCPQPLVEQRRSVGPFQVRSQ
jgi:hypothetical protein